MPNKPPMVIDKDYFLLAIICHLRISFESQVQKKTLSSSSWNANFFFFSAKIAGRRHKRAIVTEFYLCDASSGKYINECGRSGEKLKIKCKFVKAQTCVFKVGCSQKGVGFDCPVPAHMFHYLHCCDYQC